jgi:ABC-2 type transport system permease protein
MWDNVRAELLKQTRRPANWLLLAVADLLTLTFAYVVPYAGGASGPSNGGRGPDATLPAQFVGNAIGGMPISVGALALTFGVLVAGSEYGWQTWKTVLTQRPSRVMVHGAKVATVAAGVTVLVLTLLGSSALASAVVTGLEGRPMAWPGLSDVLLGFGVGWLICMMWGSLGLALAIGLRGVALPIGLGLVWLLAVQNLISAIAARLLDWVAELQKALPGPNAGSLVASLGASENAPGVARLVGSGQAAAVVGAYLLVFTVVSGRMLHRQDIE